MSPSLVDIERAFTRMCFDVEPRDADLDALHGDRDRWLLYRSMVRHRLYQMIRSGLPRTAKLLGPARFDDAIARYLAEAGPTSRFIRDVVHELLAHAIPRWETDASLPPHLIDLARYEETKWRVASLEEGARAIVELDFERPAVINATARTVTVRFRVDKPKEVPVALDEPHLAIVYRRPGSARISTYVLNDIGARLYRAWSEDQSCADGARHVLAELDRAPDARFIDGMAGVLAELVQEKIILGSPPLGG